MPELNWIGKEDVLSHHNEIPFRLLKADPNLSIGSNSENLIIQGDNLIALKALLPYYEGRIKCIYIDPPYNTGNEDWKYNDNVNSPTIKKWLNDTVKKDTLDRHSRWLCMMYPRLKLLYQLLAKDGAIFISIDDNELASLIFLCDDIFGESNHIATVVRRRRESQANLSKNLSTIHEYVVCYAHTNNFVINKLKNNIDYGELKNPDNDPRGPYTTMPCTNKGGGKYKIITPTGKEHIDEWRFKEETFKQLSDDNRIVFPRKGDGKPRYKLFLSEKNNEGIIPNSWWEDVASNQEGSTELKEIFMGKIVFENPKPVGLIKRVLELSTVKDSIVLDSFGGTGTTAHAILDLNKIDGGNRKFILIEMEENICKEITAERVKRVAHGYMNSKNEQVEGLGGDFQYCTLGEELKNKTGEISDSVVQYPDLAHLVWFQETKTSWKQPTTNGELQSFLGKHNGVSYYLFFNGIMGDTDRNKANVLTPELFKKLTRTKNPKVIFAEQTLVNKAKLKKHNIQFKQIPQEIRTK